MIALNAEDVVALKNTVAAMRPQLELLGLGEQARKIEAALLLEDYEKVQRFMLDAMRSLRASLVKQIEIIDDLLNSCREG